ncbi:sugar ABC transporter ATP-binding protein [Dinoroseobacter sp. S76]|uniref:sugar ABC transporter ATP-binding protein n=1 Tax=Dinoroseobacter sp. S76 TaxID=3415124 RepID=UPI003C79F797
MTGDAPFMRLRDLEVHYGPVRALSGVDLDIRAGRIHAIIGENGAGKSTLLKAIAGVQPPTHGRIEINGAPVAFANAVQAQRAGVSCIFQEMSLVPDLSVADNILLADPPMRFGLINRRAQRRQVARLLERVGASDLNPNTMVRDLPLSRRQLVEIAKGLARDPKLLIFDESTSALTNSDTRHILSLACQLRDEGLAILYVSHRMGEIRELADECSVFRSGRKVESFDANARSDSEIVEMMLGRSIEASFPPLSSVHGDDTLVEIDQLSWAGVLQDVRASARRGEIVGIGGLDGQGQHELLLALFGALKGTEGSLRLAGTDANTATPAERVRRTPTMAYVPEDRGSLGLAQQMSIGDNILLASKAGYIADVLRAPGRNESRLSDVMTKLKVKAASPRQPAFTLSGGNQQKVVLAKWLLETPDILLLDDPTRGIDVGTKQEIFVLLQELAAAGCTIFLYSSDYQELANCCHRVLVFYEGRVSHELSGEMLTENNLVNAAFNLPLQAVDAVKEPLATKETPA